MSTAASQRRSSEAVAVVPPRWLPIHDAAPLLAVTMLRYVEQITVSLRPATVHAVEIDLRIFAGFLIDHDPALSCAADIDRSHIEAFKLWQRAQPGITGAPTPHRDVAHVLRADHRVGLGRRPGPGADLLRRRPPTR